MVCPHVCSGGFSSVGVLLLWVVHRIQFFGTGFDGALGVLGKLPIFIHQI